MVIQVSDFRMQSLVRARCLTELKLTKDHYVFIESPLQYIPVSQIVKRLNLCLGGPPGILLEVPHDIAPALADINLDDDGASVVRSFVASHARSIVDQSMSMEGKDEGPVDRVLYIIDLNDARKV